MALDFMGGVLDWLYHFGMQTEDKMHASKLVGMHNNAQALAMQVDSINTIIDHVKSGNTVSFGGVQELLTEHFPKMDLLIELEKFHCGRQLRPESE